MPVQVQNFYEVSSAFFHSPFGLFCLGVFIALIIIGIVDTRGK